MRLPAAQMNEADRFEFPETPVQVPTTSATRAEIATTLVEAARDNNLPSSHIRSASAAFYISDALADIVYGDDIDDYSEEESVDPNEVPTPADVLDDDLRARQDAADVDASAPDNAVEKVDNATDDDTYVTRSGEVKSSDTHEPVMDEIADEAPAPKRGRRGGK